MTVRIVTEPAEWNGLIDRLANRGLDDVYFRPPYSFLYAEPHNRSELLVFEDSRQLLAMPWIVRPIDLPGATSLFDFETPYGYGGPLSTTDDVGFVEAAWNAIVQHCQERRIVCGFVRFHPLLDNDRWTDARSMAVIDDRPTVVLTLSKSRECVMAGYSQDTRSKVRKGEKAGVEVSEQSDGEGLQTFARLYETHMMELGAHDDYFFGERYFRSVPTLGEGSWRLYLARRGKDILGGALVLLSRRWAHYHLSSSLKEYSAFAPNTMLRHVITMDLLGGRQERLHYGGGRTAAADDGLLRFKAGFSPERALFRFGKFLADSSAYESICNEWERTCPHLVDQYGGRFLKYRYR